MQDKNFLSIEALSIIIILYERQNSNTMRNQNFEDFQRTSAFRRLQPPQNDFAALDLNGLGISKEMMQVINSQNILIMKLLEQQNALYKELNKKLQSSDSGSGTNDKKNPQIKISGYRQSNILEQFSSSSNKSGGKIGGNQTVKIIQRPVNIVKSPRTLKKVDFKGEINSSPQQASENSKQKQKSNEKRRQTQTKNMVKNFAKAIFSYIRKNKEKKLQVLDSLKISQADFDKTYEQYKGRIHSITELRSLWSAEGNPFHQAFRMLSCQYLRKHCWARTFNSRVENYTIHLKYRKRLLEVIENPMEFRALKTN